MTTDRQTDRHTLGGVTYAIWQFVAFCLYSGEFALMMAATATETGG